jgi:hypothetical protein
MPLLTITEDNDEDQVLAVEEDEEQRRLRTPEINGLEKV